MVKNSESKELIDGKNCLGCRLVSGIGMILIAGYLHYQGRNRRYVEKLALNIISTGPLGLGIARIFNLYPFNRKK